MKFNLKLNKDIYQEFINIESGLFSPLKGFMNLKDYLSVVNNMTLFNGTLWTLPVTFNVDKETYRKISQIDRIYFQYKEKEIGYMDVEDCFEVNIEEDVEKIFKTKSKEHPGVNREFNNGKYKIGGKTCLTDRSLLKGELVPEFTKEIFAKKGWKTIAGFQTRNPIHKAHEYHHRTALEICDGLFINPLVGWKKRGDFTDMAIIESYNFMLNNIFPKDRVYFETLKTPMRYAGPREAIFHSIIRKNLGCTHFIIGRDHAGVGDYYGKYEAHELAKKLENENLINSQILYFKEPYYCKKCEMMCTENTCGHSHNEENIIRISGTKVRKEIAEKNGNDTFFLRKEIAEILKNLEKNLFIEE